MYILAGTDLSTYFNDVWASTDGVIWTQITAAAGYKERGEEADARDSCICCVCACVCAYVRAYVRLCVCVTRAHTHTHTQMHARTQTCTHMHAWSHMHTLCRFGGRWLHSSVAFRNNLWVLGGHACAAPPGTQQPEVFLVLVHPFLPPSSFLFSTLSGCHT